MREGEEQMRTRTIKKEIIPYIVCAGLFALAGILQYIDNEVTIFWDKLLSLVINLIFFLLIFIWGNSAKNRIVEKSTRRLHYCCDTDVYVAFAALRQILLFCIVRNGKPLFMVYVLYPAMPCAAACVDRGNGADEKKQSFGLQMFVFGIGAGGRADFTDSDQRLAPDGIRVQRKFCEF